MEDTDPTARAIDVETEPGGPQGRARRGPPEAASTRTSATQDDGEDLDRLLGGLRSDGHFRPEPKQTASTNGESFAAHAAAPRALAPANTDPKLDPILIDVTSPDGIPLDGGSDPDGSAVTAPLPRPVRKGGVSLEDVVTGPDEFHLDQHRRRRRRVVLSVASAVAVALLVSAGLLIGRTSPPNPPVTPAAAAPPAATALPAVTTVMATATATTSASVTAVPSSPPLVTAPSLPSAVAFPPNPQARPAAPPATVLPAASVKHVPLVSPKEEDDDIARGRR